MPDPAGALREALDAGAEAARADPLARRYAADVRRLIAVHDLGDEAAAARAFRAALSAYCLEGDLFGPGEGA